MRSAELYRRCIVPIMIVLPLQLRGYPDLQEHAYTVNDVLGTKLAEPEHATLEAHTNSNRSLQKRECPN